jgi:hypothetical protein
MQQSPNQQIDKLMRDLAPLRQTLDELFTLLREKETRNLVAATDTHAVYRAQGRVMLLQELLAMVERCK